jgi:hypothetical protein
MRMVEHMNQALIFAPGGRSRGDIAICSPDALLHAVQRIY